MNERPTLFDAVDAQLRDLGVTFLLADPDRATPGLHHAHAHDTERAAASWIMPRSGTLRRLVLDAIAAAYFYGLTDDEMQVQLGMNPSTQRPRRVELSEDGWITDSGDRRTTRGGRQAIVWKLTPEGRQQWKENL